MLEAKDVKELLRNNIVEVVFEKKDGSERTMFCTLLQEFLPSRGELIAQESEDDNIITVWDLEYDSWRSFALDRVKSIEAEPIE